MTSTDNVTRIGKLRPEVKEKWVAALRSGDYKQGRSYLHTVDEEGGDRFCCLGVLCDLAVKEGKVAVSRERLGDSGTAYMYGESLSYPADSVVGWAYLVEPDEYHAWRVPAEESAEEDVDPFDELVELNDERELTFGQIADRIEAGL